MISFWFFTHFLPEIGIEFKEEFWNHFRLCWKFSPEIGCLKVKYIRCKIILLVILKLLFFLLLIFLIFLFALLISDNFFDLILDNFFYLLFRIIFLAVMKSHYKFMSFRISTELESPSSRWMREIGKQVKLRRNRTLDEEEASIVVSAYEIELYLYYLYYM